MHTHIKEVICLVDSNIMAATSHYKTFDWKSNVHGNLFLQISYLYNFCFSPFSFFCAVRRRFVWVYASIQFALVVLFAHIFYTLVSNVSSTIISKTHIPLSKHNKNNNNDYFFHHYSLQQSFNVPEKIK